MWRDFVGDSRFRKMHGRFCEALVAHILQKKNYKIIKKNFNCIAGEVDIIISKGLFIIFVEVKSWNYYPENELRRVITRDKLRRIQLCSQHYFKDTQGHDESWARKHMRIDVILVQLLRYRMVHYKGV